MLLVHGFPEPGYSWRKVMLPIAAAGFHVMAPDQRGYGGTDVRFDDDLAPFSVARAGISGKAGNPSRRRGPESDSRGSGTPDPVNADYRLRRWSVRLHGHRHRS